jgi:hypothetical protein
MPGNLITCLHPEEVLMGYLVELLRIRIIQSPEKPKDSTKRAKCCDYDFHTGFDL